jgi:hypothetical protein
MAKYLGIPLKLTGGTTVTPTYGSAEVVKSSNFKSTDGWGFPSGWSISTSSEKASVDATSPIALQQNGLGVTNGVEYSVRWKMSSYVSGALQVQFGGSQVIASTSANNTFDYRVTSSVTNSILYLYAVAAGTTQRKFSVDYISVKEVSLGNYLQVDGGDFLSTCKVGDVVFNTTDNTEAIIVEVLDNNTLLLSNDSLSIAGDAFSIFAGNGDTRGNQILKIDNYIISEYDEATSAANASSFWFASGPQADKVTLTQLNNAVNTYFVADVIERFVQRLNAQSATASRLDIPLDEFRDHKYNQVLTTTAITLS